MQWTSKSYALNISCSRKMIYFKFETDAPLKVKKKWKYSTVLFDDTESADLCLCTKISSLLVERPADHDRFHLLLPVVTCNVIPRGEKPVSRCGKLRLYSPHLTCAYEWSAYPRTKVRLVVKTSTWLTETNEKICKASRSQPVCASDFSLFNFRTRCEGSITYLECSKMWQCPAADRDITYRTW